jgi:uncharacterized protein (DUF488 family)
MSDSIFTIGHSTHALERFVELLQQCGITALCDVRSNPHSRMNPQFNRKELNVAMRGRGIRYVFLGRELGARSKDPACYENGKVQYERLARTAPFRRGLQRVQNGMKSYRIAVMCAEKEPLECHRTILVARALAAAGLDVQHIHADGTLESHSDALKRLAGMFNLDGPDIFRSPDELIADAYRCQEKRIAHEAEIDSGDLSAAAQAGA